MSLDKKYDLADDKLTLSLFHYMATSLNALSMNSLIIKEPYTRTQIASNPSDGLCR